ncbi:MAG: PQQ-dependent sugar dehydrogenase [Flavobacteriaceae bacterium]|nr:PQQ-dependent sugar dehydrogenase [Flavobacteriaceae bacterium]
MIKALHILFLFGVLFACAQQPKENDILLKEDPKDYQVQHVIQLDEIIWGMDFINENELLLTEKEGKLLHYKKNSEGNFSLVAEISGVPEVYLRGQGGFLDIKAHPEFRTNKTVFFTLASSLGEDSGGNTALYSAKLSGSQLQEVQLLYKATPNTKRGVHFGSRIVFDKSGNLYFSIGDRGNRDENPQSLSLDGGKVYRIKSDASIPSDNPFVQQADAIDAIYTYGHRNPQGMIYIESLDEVWVHEHGPRGGDEINRLKPGKNYGWPVITYGINYSGTKITDKTTQEGMEQPLYYWVPSIAPSGFAYYANEQKNTWNHSLLVGSLKFQYLERLSLDKDWQVVGREKLLDGLGRVRDVVIGPDKGIYVSVEGKGVFKVAK